MSQITGWWRAHRSAAGLALGLVAITALGASALPAAMAAALGSPAAAGAASLPAPSSSPSIDPSPLASVSCVLSQSKVVYGAEVTVSGAVTPAAEGQTVTIALAGADVASAVTDAAGVYSVAFTPTRGGDTVARLADGTSSAAASLSVTPKVTIAHGTPYPFLNVKYTINVQPASYNGTVTTALWHNGKRVWQGKRTVSGGKAVFSLPLRGVGWFTAKATLPAVEGLAARQANHSVKPAGKTLRVGSKGPHVRGLLTALNRLKIRVPSIGWTLTRDAGDAVIAFQKAYRLPRTYVFDADDWKKLDTAKTVKPRHASPYDHLEVDKTRQILMMVRGGSVRGLIAISSGATGNTPEGSFRILQKSSATGSSYGGTLFRVMGFYGNFAIHGYVPVPPYPASHGCVREPMWVADWVYDRTALGERLYIYR